MNAKDAVFVLAILQLMACARFESNAPPADHLDKEPAAMEIAPATPGESHKKGDAASVLEGLLRLIERSKDISDFTRHRVESELGMSMKVVHGGSWGSSRQITREWWVSTMMQPHVVSGLPTFSLDFGSDPPDSRPSMTDICGMDLPEFGERLERLGMQHEIIQDEHGLVLSQRYARTGIEVEVLGREEVGDGASLRDHQCVKTVLVY